MDWSTKQIADNYDEYKNMQVRSTCTMYVSYTPLTLCGKYAPTGLYIDTGHDFRGMRACSLHMEKMYAMVSGGYAPAADPSPAKCNCPMQVIMLSGCKCGGI